MYISRIVIRNFRNFALLDCRLQRGVTCIIGENNTGKTNLLHAIRLALDIKLPNYQRSLIEHDIHSGVSLNKPFQVLVSVEFSDFQDNVNKCAFVGEWHVGDFDLARLTCRFRPVHRVRSDIEEAEEDVKAELIESLSLEDYRWELIGGGDIDPANAAWNEDFGSSVNLADLQSFHVDFLDALRDVQQDLRRDRVSPLRRLIRAKGIPQDEKEEIEEIISRSND